MKSSMAQKSHTEERPDGYRDRNARFHPEISGQVMALNRNYKYMKSSLTRTSHTGMIIRNARFHMSFKKQL
jgi:hypothetical protein